jgi:hypothetical protein
MSTPFNGATKFVIQSDGTAVITYANGDQKRYAIGDLSAHDATPVAFHQAVKSSQIDVPYQGIHGGWVVDPNYKPNTDGYGRDLNLPK